ncbi:hypothetical protein [Mycobacterium botniense]|uniref:Uncharacterized protein n=1 Tax=Mycobacterium botniense TaxID=84962 RepID=A0A7I9XSH6_9MYCO|nr:hypothetical protein [Mycobacterium botniense]GFG72953.1 hypothetical protein MBOT_03180 [Mycobacterium botniense]
MTTLQDRIGKSLADFTGVDFLRARACAVAQTVARSLQPRHPEPEHTEPDAQPDRHQRDPAPTELDVPAPHSHLPRIPRGVERC